MTLGSGRPMCYQPGTIADGTRSSRRVASSLPLCCDRTHSADKLPSGDLRVRLVGGHQPVPGRQLGPCSVTTSRGPLVLHGLSLRQLRDGRGQGQRPLHRLPEQPRRQHRPAADQHLHRRHDLVERLHRRHRRRHREGLQGHPRLLGGRRRPPVAGSPTSPRSTRCGTPSSPGTAPTASSTSSR